MSRPWRIEYQGALYHLMSRGNAGSNIVLDDRDRHRFLGAVGEMSDRFDIEIFAYVLMDNHYHLLVRTRQANLKKAMHWFGTTYTQRLNWRHSRDGHLFQGRYKSIVVENNAYLLQLSYSIHRNPLRARIVKRLAGYRWSSYKVYAYGHKSPDWLSTGLILSQFGEDQDRHREYRRRVQKYASEEKRLFEDLRHGSALGSNKFVEKLSRKYAPANPEFWLPQQKKSLKILDPDKYLRSAEKIFKCDIDHFVNAKRLSGTQKEVRDILLYGIWKAGQLNNEQIGSLFGISYSGVSHAVKSAKRKLSSNRQLQMRFNRLNSLFKR
jgi:REP element-mobilizing transposase RayT